MTNASLFTPYCCAVCLMEELNNEALSYANSRSTVMRLAGEIKLQMQQLFDINNMLNSKSMPLYKISDAVLGKRIL
jgi:hypothetical protein